MKRLLLYKKKNNFVRLERINLAMTQLVEILIHLYKNMETFQIPKQIHFAGSIRKFGKIGVQFW